jgi:hypothetical protein
MIFWSSLSTRLNHQNHWVSTAEFFNRGDSERSFGSGARYLNFSAIAGEQSLQMGHLAERELVPHHSLALRRSGITFASMQLLRACPASQTDWVRIATVVGVC